MLLEDWQCPAPNPLPHIRSSVYAHSSLCHPISCSAMTPCTSSFHVCGCFFYFIFFGWFCLFFMSGRKVIWHNRVLSSLENLARGEWAVGIQNGACYWCYQTHYWCSSDSPAALLFWCPVFYKTGARCILPSETWYKALQFALSN